MQLTKKMKQELTVEDISANRPDVSLANRIKAIFEDDPQITCRVETASDNRNRAILVMEVTNASKAAGLRKLLPPSYEIGNLELTVDIEDVSEIDESAVRAAFEGNPHFKEFMTITDPNTMREFHLCIFEKEAIQFQNDNAASLNGFETRVMEELCREAINIPTLCFTTDDGTLD